MKKKKMFGKLVTPSFWRNLFRKKWGSDEPHNIVWSYYFLTVIPIRSISVGWLLYVSPVMISGSSLCLLQRLPILGPLEQARMIRSRVKPAVSRSLENLFVSLRIGVFQAAQAHNISFFFFDFFNSMTLRVSR